MKKIIIPIACILLGFLWESCQDVTVGYLLIDNVEYSVDSLVVKVVLDDDPGDPNPEYYELKEQGWTHQEIADYFDVYDRINYGEDYYRSRYNYPWVSGSFEGLEGTDPIIVSVKGVTSADGDAALMMEKLYVRGNGILELPLKHGLPAGRYVISLNFRNEGYSKDMNDCFTIIIK